MKKLTTAALLLALFCVPAIAEAATTGASTAVVGGSPSARPLDSAPARALRDEARDYAAREAATPALAGFQGGGGGVYIGGGAVTVVLLVLLIVIVL
jgi:hypothetical protein